MTAPLPEHLRFLQDIDWSKPTGTGPDGHPYYLVDCRAGGARGIWFSFRHGDGVAAVVPDIKVSDKAVDIGVALDATRVFDDDGDGVVLDPAASGDPGTDDEIEWGRGIVEGVASSTGVDFYGTEMSLRALTMMAQQMGSADGLAYLPQHNHGLSGPTEWHEAIGRTVHAEVVPVEADAVIAPHDASEPQYILRAWMKLYASDPMARKLVHRVTPPPKGEGQKIGQSIGGWFTQLRVVANEEGEVERVIVEGVELDHLAVTRAPANADAHTINHLRSAVESSMYARRIERFLGHLDAGRTIVCPVGLAKYVRDAAPETRDVSVKDNRDGTASVVFTIPVEDSGTILGAVDRAAIPFRSYPLADAGESWTWTAAESNEVLGDNDWSRYRQAHTWEDPDASEESKARYKLPHHKGTDLRTYLSGARAAIAVLNGARGGINMPDEDREPTYNHLARHVREFDEEPAPLRSRAYIEAERAAATAAGRPYDLDAWLDALDPADAGAAAQTAFLDRFHRERDDTSVSSDARSAGRPDTTTTPAPADVGAPSEEPEMPELTLDAIRALFDEKVAPISVRLAALEEQVGIQRQNPDPDPAEAATATAATAVAGDDELKKMRARAEQAEQRAKLAESRLGDAVLRSHRVGHSVGRANNLTIDGPSSRGVFDGLVERARAEAPTLAAMAARALPVIMGEPDGKAPRQARHSLEDVLRSLCVAAEEDGLIVDPMLRAGWA